jgi:Rod binding domain-containing protein
LSDEEAIPVSSILPSSLPSVSPELAAPAVPTSRGAKAAQEFEAQLIGSLLESMEKTFGSVPGEDTMPGADDYNYLGTHALAETLAAHGGFGLAALITRHLPTAAPHEGKG